jgi:hypothetical protein
MSLEWIPIYASATALAALMVAFSAHNRKIGWKKARPTMLEALNDLYADLGVERSLSSLPSALITSAVPDADFSLQLLKLRGALGSSNPAPVDVEHLVSVEQLVAVGSAKSKLKPR